MPPYINIDHYGRNMYKAYVLKDALNGGTTIHYNLSYQEFMVFKSENKEVFIKSKRYLDVACNYKNTNRNQILLSTVPTDSFLCKECEDISLKDILAETNRFVGSPSRYE